MIVLKYMDAQLADICEQQHTLGSCSPREGSDFSMAFKILCSSLCSPSGPSHLLDLVPLSLPTLAASQPRIPSYLLTFTQASPLAWLTGRTPSPASDLNFSLGCLDGRWGCVGIP